MGLTEELEAIAAAAATFAAEGERVAAILPAEPGAGERTYLCAFERDGDRSWLALDAGGRPVRERVRVRDAVSIAAMCELAEEAAGGGDLEELRRQLVTVRLTEAPPGIEQAEAAALELERTLDPPPRVATPRYLDAIGAATRHLERALGDASGSAFAQVMQHAAAAVDALASEVEASYKAELR